MELRLHKDYSASENYLPAACDDCRLRQGIPFYYVPSRKKVLADQLSRVDQVLQMEWTIVVEVLAPLWLYWSHALVDAFTTDLHYRL